MIAHSFERVDQTPLADTGIAALLLDLMAVHGLASQRELAKELDVAPNTVNRLMTNPYVVPTETTLEKVARYAGLPITRVREIAERAPGEPGRFVLPREFDQLSTRERKLMLELGWVLLDAHARRVTR
mgnify:CR=1 FL=1